MQATFLLFHPVCVCVWTDLTDCWRKHDWHKLWLSDSFPSHSHVISVGARLFPLTSSLSPTIPFLHYLSASDVSPPSLPPSSHSIFGIELCRPGGTGFSCGNERGHPEGGSTHRFWDPAAGRCLCHRNPIRSPGHPLYWARQPSWEVTQWDA